MVGRAGGGSVSSASTPSVLKCEEIQHEIEETDVGHQQFADICRPSVLLGLAGVTLSNQTCGAHVIYCTNVGYPAGCVARQALCCPPTPPLRRAAVRHNAGGNMNGGVESRWSAAVKDVFAGHEPRHRQAKARAATLH